MRILIATFVLVTAVTEVSGQKLTPAEVRELVPVVNRIPGFVNPDRYNPRETIVAVNALQPLPKSQSLRVLSQSSGLGSAIVMRFLFDPPAGGLHPTTYLPYEGYKSNTEPGYPAVIVEGVPLYLFPLGPWGLGGGLPKPAEYIDWYRANGTVRNAVLTPTDDPLDVWTTWSKSALRARIANASQRQAAEADALVKKQLLRLIETIHPREFDEDTLIWEDLSVLWDSALKTLDATETRWDSALVCYVRAADGSFIEPVAEQEYRVVPWQLPFPGRTATMTIHRLSEKKVEVEVRVEARGAEPAADGLVAVVLDGDAPKELAVLVARGSLTSGSYVTVSTFDVPVGSTLSATFERDGEVIASRSGMSPDELVQDRK